MQVKSERCLSHLAVRADLLWNLDGHLLVARQSILGWSIVFLHMCAQECRRRTTTARLGGSANFPHTPHDPAKAKIHELGKPDPILNHDASFIGLPTRARGRVAQIIARELGC